MSKVKKKPTSQPTSISEIDIKLEKIIQNSGLLMLIACLGCLGIIGLLDLLNIKETEATLNAMSFAFIIFTGASSGLTLGVVVVLKNKRDQKRNIFLDWMLAEFLLCVFAIFTVAAYQW